MKKPERNWDASLTKDYLRTKIVVESEEDAYKIVDEIKSREQFKVIYVKDLYQNPADGYRALHVRASMKKFKSSFIEIQVVDKITNRMKYWSRLFFTDHLFIKFIQYRALPVHHLCLLDRVPVHWRGKCAQRLHRQGHRQGQSSEKAHTFWQDKGQKCDAHFRSFFYPGCRPRSSYQCLCICTCHYQSGHHAGL